MFKYKNNLLPNIFNEFYQTNSSFHQYPTRKSNQLRGPQTKTRLAQTFIRNSGASIWNEFSEILDHKSSLNIFKKEAINVLISGYDS